MYEGIQKSILPDKEKLRQMCESGQHRGIFPSGAGKRPMIYIGREAQIEQLDALPKDLISGDEPGNIKGMVINGPRGTGKSVLLSSLSEAAQDADIVALRMTGQVLTTEHKAINKLNGLLPSNKTITESAKGGADASLKVLGTGVDAKGEVSRSEQFSEGYGAAASIHEALEQVLTSIDEPLLITVDECHAADPVVLGGLLNAVHDLDGAAGRTGIVLAGTPDLITLLNRGDCRATWLLDRIDGEDGLVALPNDVSVEDTTNALRKIIHACGIEIKSESDFNAACDQCLGSPYFIQYLGYCAISNATGGVVDFSPDGHLMAKFKTLKRKRYGRSWRAIKDKGLESCAYQLGSLWDSLPVGRINRDNIKSAIASGLEKNTTGSKQTLDSANNAFEHLGLLWSVTGLNEGPWSLGLPSFFDYVKDQFQEHLNLKKIVPDLDAHMQSIKSEYLGVGEFDDLGVGHEIREDNFGPYRATKAAIEIAQRLNYFKKVWVHALNVARVGKRPNTKVVIDAEMLAKSAHELQSKPLQRDTNDGVSF